MKLRFSQLIFLVLIFSNSLSVAAKEIDGSEISYRAIPKAEKQLQNFLKSVLKENGQKQGTFYVPHLKLKSGCKNVLIEHQEKDGDLKWKQFRDDSLLLNDECLDYPMILWSEGNTLFPPIFISDYIRQAVTKEEAESIMLLSLRPKDYIDLCKGVVSTPEDIGGSTYLVDREWAFQKIRAALNGDRITVHQ